jgi:hypothetical protein
MGLYEVTSLLGQGLPVACGLPITHGLTVVGGLLYQNSTVL